MEPSIDFDNLSDERAAAASAELLAALGELPAYLVGGAVRDALLGQRPAEVDVVVEGDISPVLERLGSEARAYERFGTATVRIGELRIDLARSRRERYPSPGALPEVAPAPIRADLARRDFTVNAIAVPLTGPLELIDPYEGLDDLRAGLLRVLHSDSFRDDPTRALRAARYVARLGFALEGETERWLRSADLGSVSRDRLENELGRLCAEPEAVSALLALEGWGLLELGEERRRLLPMLAELPLLEPWVPLLDRAELLVELVIGDPERLERGRRLAESTYASAAQAFELAQPNDDIVLAIARALGARWLDSYVSEWRRVRLMISGDDLIAAGVPEGPAVGRGLRAARNARIDGAIDADHEAELRVAMEAARAAQAAEPPAAADRPGGPDAVA